MTQFNVNADIIASKSAQARNQVNTIVSEVNALTASLQDLQASWTGSASSNFQAVLNNWRSTQRQVEESIAQINEALSRAGLNYAETEMANASLFMG
ncbi:MAG: WXG100 family type VII secretion target [Rothia sp. (in: high G+C Gram-positive bacteria)]|nr:WXG100 family type VII secretion target [Rothia sp. (in: high G+C Gram-positive bacteria)]